MIGIDVVGIALSATDMVLWNENIVERLFRCHNGREIFINLKLVFIRLCKVRKDGLLENTNWVERLLVNVQSNLARNSRRDVIPLVFLNQTLYT